jgi:hypothetical protein
MVYGGKMERKRSEDSFSERETARRVEDAVRGAFAGSPTPLKDIPKRDGKPRSTEKPQRRLRRQRKKRPA